MCICSTRQHIIFIPMKTHSFVRQDNQLDYCSFLSAARILANSPNKPKGLQLLNLFFLEGSILVGKLLLQTLSVNPTTQLAEGRIETWNVTMLEIEKEMRPNKENRKQHLSVRHGVKDLREIHSSSIL